MTVDTTATAIHVDRVLKATIQQVYDAWTRPELLTRWYCPNPAWELTVETDLRVGGAYVVKMGPHVVRGTYTELDEPRLIAFTWRWDGTESEASQVRVELTEVDGGTRMVLDHTGLENAEDVANHLQGWEGNLQRLPSIF
ncbi:SRPBCC domain-containing protein [Kribbella sp. NBC_01245]|uniref:SRPBCC family protein n=1 Tax=Kribbella sp. NBC_01245 TaxID=2903578 RepID=UPI002E29C319|nr:SRPBCC domain-containing protein [Kribbella sp. NBC_01245]